MLKDLLCFLYGVMVIRFLETSFDQVIIKEACFVLRSALKSRGSRAAVCSPRSETGGLTLLLCILLGRMYIRDIRAPIKLVKVTRLVAQSAAHIEFELSCKPGKHPHDQCLVVLLPRPRLWDDPPIASMRTLISPFCLYGLHVTVDCITSTSKHRKQTIAFWSKRHFMEHFRLYMCKIINHIAIQICKHSVVEIVSRR